MTLAPTSTHGLDRGAFLRRAAALAAAPTLLAATPALAEAHGRHGRPWWHRDDWPLPAHDLAGTREAARGPRGLALRWRVPLAGGVTGAPLVADRLAVAASLGGEVAALRPRRRARALARGLPAGGLRHGARHGRRSASSAARRWRHGRVLVASDRVRCLRLRDGATLWEADPLRGADGDDYFWGPPVVAAGLVLVGSGRAPRPPPPAGGCRRTPCTTAGWSGAPRWCPRAATAAACWRRSASTCAGGSAFAATGSPYVPQAADVPGTSALVELALRDGTVRFADQVHPGDALGLDFNSAPVLAGGVIAATAKDGVWAWSRRCRAAALARPADARHAGRRRHRRPHERARGRAHRRRRRRVLRALQRRAARPVGGRGDLAAQRARALADRPRRLHVRRAGVAGPWLVASTASGDLEVLRTRDGRAVARVPLGGPSAGAVAAGGGPPARRRGRRAVPARRRAGLPGLSRADSRRGGRPGRRRRSASPAGRAGRRRPWSTGSSANTVTSQSAPTRSRPRRSPRPARRAGAVVYRAGSARASSTCSAPYGTSPGAPGSRRSRHHAMPRRGS